MSSSAGIDLETVAAHEIGHSIGINHTTISSALMAPFYSGEHRFLSKDDELAVLKLYQGPPINSDLVAVWVDDRDANGIYQIRGRGLLNTGLHAFADLTVNSRPRGQQFRSKVASDENGNFVVVWADDSDDNGMYQIHARGFYPDGRERIKQFVVNTVADGQQINPDIAMQQDGSFVVVWEDDYDSNRKYQIKARTFDESGNEISNQFTVNKVAKGQQVRPKVAISEDDNFVVTWEDDQDNNGWYQIHARGFKLDGTEVISQFTVNSVSDGQQRNPDIAMAEDGRFIIVWEDDQDNNKNFQILGKVFEPSGTEVVEQFTVNSISDGQQLMPKVAM